MLFNSGEPLLGALWFVIPLFIVNFMFLIIRKIDIRTGGKYNVTTWIVIFFFILGYFADYNKYPLLSKIACHKDVCENPPRG